MSIYEDLKNCKTADDFWEWYSIYEDEEGAIKNATSWNLDNRLNSNLLDDEDVMYQLCYWNRPSNFKYVSDRLKNDKSFAARVIAKDGLVLEHVGDKLKSDKSLVFFAVYSNYLSFRYASEELKFDRDLLICACRYQIFGKTPEMTVYDFVKNLLPTDFELDELL